jgi:hypothetical protein
MQSIIRAAVAVICTSLFPACSTLHSDLGMSGCPELEGYPDCQNGNKMDTPPLAVR